MSFAAVAQTEERHIRNVEVACSTQVCGLAVRAQREDFETDLCAGQGLRELTQSWAALESSTWSDGGLLNRLSRFDPGTLRSLLRSRRRRSAHSGEADNIVPIR